MKLDKNLEDDEFRAKIEEVNNFSELLLVLDNQTSGEHEDFVRLGEKALTLVTTTEEAIELWNAGGKIAGTEDDFSKRTLEKMVELIRTTEELQAVYYVLSSEENEIKRRQLVRKMFDKADELGYPTL